MMRLLASLALVPIMWARPSVYSSTPNANANATATEEARAQILHARATAQPLTEVNAHFNRTNELTGVDGKIYGVNIGGWLVLEPWIRYSHTDTNRHHGACPGSNAAGPPSPIPPQAVIVRAVQPRRHGGRRVGLLQEARQNGMLEAA